MGCVLHRGGRHAAEQRCKAVQVDPMKPRMKPPGTERLKSEHDGLLSNFGFKFKLRRYSVLVRDAAQYIAGRGLHSSTSQLDLSRF